MIKFFRALKFAFQYMYRNIGMSFACIVVMALSFFIVSMIGLAFYFSLVLVRYVDSRPALIIFLRGDLTEENKNKFVDLVNSTKLVRELDLKDLGYSKNDLLTKYNDPQLSEFLEGDLDPVFMPRIAFVYGDSQENLEKLISILQNDEYFITNIVDRYNIDRVGWYSFNKDQADIIKEANNLIFWIGSVSTALLVVISSILVIITIRLSINYHRREIEIMYLVGADGWFIRMPFIVSGIMYGVLGAFFSTTSILLLRSVIAQVSSNFVPRIVSFFSGVNFVNVDDMMILKIYGLTMLVGALIGLVSSLIATLRYVKK